MNAFRFSASIPSGGSTKQLIEDLREMEDLGYSAFLLSDHLMNEYAPLSTLSTAAAVTRGLRVGSFVFNNDLRHPMVLAQELATLDRLSEGRLEVGIGAGWNRMEYEAAGITFDPGQVRVARLKEAVHVLKGLFREGDFEFRGSHYQVKGLAERPLPLQQPHPPFMIGGGSAAVLGFAAQNAQIVGLAPRVLPDGRPDVIGCTLAGTRKKVEIIREAAGSRLAGLEINTYPSLGARVTDSRSALSEVRERVGRRSGVELSDQDLLESPHVFIGTIDSLAEKFQMLRETLGINNFFVGDDFRAFAPLVARFS